MFITALTLAAKHNYVKNSWIRHLLFFFLTCVWVEENVPVPREKSFPELFVISLSAIATDD